MVSERILGELLLIIKYFIIENPTVWFNQNQKFSPRAAMCFINETTKTNKSVTIAEVTDNTKIYGISNVVVKNAFRFNR